LNLTVATSSMSGSLSQGAFIAGWLAACALLSSGCSYLESFFIVNGSATPLVVVANADVWAHAETGVRVCAWSVHGQSPLPLKGTDADRIGRIAPAWDEMSDIVGSEFDETTCSVRTTIEPRSAVLIWGTTNGQRGPFLAGLIIGEGGDTLGRVELLKRFRKRSRHVYTLEVK
jgi:hypothetical protein